VRAALLLLLATSVAHAESIPAKARALADRGRAAHDQGDYAAAIAAFTEAYAIAPAPGLLFNLAQAYRLKGNCESAQLMYRRYLGASPPDDGRALAEGHLAAVDRCMQQKTMRVTVDPQLRVFPLPKPPPAPRPSPRHRSDLEKVGAVVAITGGAVLLAAAYNGLVAHHLANEVERRYAAGEPWPKLAPLDAEGDRAAVRARASALGGAAVIAAGVTMFVVGHRKRTAIHVEPTTRGARIGARWRF
jgi:tetratricopeptide (TPR) repeat protein